MPPEIAFRQSIYSYYQIVHGEKSDMALGRYFWFNVVKTSLVDCFNLASVFDEQGNNVAINTQFFDSVIGWSS